MMLAQNISIQKSPCGEHRGFWEKCNIQPVLSEVLKPWSVQVIALWENNPLALAAIKRSVEAMGYEATIADVNGAKKIRVGPYESLAAVRLVLYEMRTNGYPDAFLCKRGRGR